MEEKNCQLKTKERPDHRLKKINQFNYIYRKGERKSTKHFTLYIVKSKYSNYKIGYSISKKVGKANQRNLLRRRMKEIVRINTLAQNGHNYVLLARVGAGQLSFQEIEFQLKKLFNER